MPPGNNNSIDNDDTHSQDNIESKGIQTNCRSISDPQTDIETGGMNNEVTDDENEKNDVDVKALRAYFRKLSMTVNGEEQLSVDKERIARSVRDAGEYAFGIMAVEVWILDENTCMLSRQNGGWWRNPDFDESEALRRLEDNSHPSFASPYPVVPGVDLAGVLWAESVSCYSSLKQNRQPRRSISASLHHIASLNGYFSGEKEVQRSILVWRDLHTLVIDPFIPKERLALFEEAGFGQAAGVPFNVDGQKGIVIYFALSTVNKDQLTCLENEAYLLKSAKLIGFTSAVTEVRRACVASKNKNAEIPEETEQVIGPDEILQQQKKSICKVRQTQIIGKLTTWMKKCLGGNSSPPPALSFQQSLWTLIGVFFGLLVISAMNQYAMKYSNNQYHVLIGPFGALMTLQYALTAAPVAQPQNIVLGQVIAGAISMSFTYIPDSVLSPWLRQAFSPAVAIASMAKLGIIHPPAGASAVIYASGNYGWMFYFLTVLASIISIIPATIINNMSEKRQYPIYWGGFNKRFMPKRFSVSQ